ncbi:MAG: hypothetical protein NZ651_06230 [Candidatus Bipolaricaulota bacterium]|nr:hypothetical protein [Candidatus Bipolaricaulota bacterium]MDW8127351.1 hypothetical protein [Candidatus Bipolaricaulota bacterium]
MSEENVARIYIEGFYDADGKLRWRAWDLRRGLCVVGLTREEAEKALDEEEEEDTGG